MNDGYPFSFAGEKLVALPEGALWCPTTKCLCVSDLHLGKSDRIARRSGRMVPPYENRATLEKLDTLVSRHNPQTIICLGDSFDDLDAVQSLDDSDHDQIATLQAGREWIWIEGNHDPGHVALGGDHRAEFRAGPLTFRHIATTDSQEISGHYHPKCRLPSGGSRPAFLIDDNRIIMPAFGTYTGGLWSSHPTLRHLMGDNTLAVLTGRKAIPVPFNATV